MKFLVDECLPPSFARLVATHGHDVRHAGDVGLLGAPDEKVLAEAARQDRVLISADTDFGELLAMGNHVRPSLLLLRGTVRNPYERAQRLLDNLPVVTEYLDDGAVVVITDERIRVRPLPIGR